MAIVYLITNKINGKKYIGVDKNNNPNYLGSGISVKLAIKKYGKNNFTKDIIEECHVSNVYDREIYWIKRYNAVNSSNYYNISDGGKGGNKLNNPESYRKWLRNKQNLSELNSQRKGKTYEDIYGENADKEKEKRRNSLIGSEHSIERRENQSKSHKGLIPWNKGLTKTGDIRVLKNINNRISPKFIKIYEVTTPELIKYVFHGKKELKAFIVGENKLLVHGKKININRLISNKIEKEYKLNFTKNGT